MTAALSLPGHFGKAPRTGSPSTATRGSAEDAHLTRHHDGLRHLHELRGVPGSPPGRPLVDGGHPLLEQDLEPHLDILDGRDARQAHLDRRQAVRGRLQVVPHALIREAHGGRAVLADYPCSVQSMVGRGRRRRSVPVGSASGRQAGRQARRACARRTLSPRPPESSRESDCTARPTCARYGFSCTRRFASAWRPIDASTRSSTSPRRNSARATAVADAPLAEASHRCSTPLRNCRCCLTSAQIATLAP